MNHELTLTQDDDGWDVAECSCGWISPPSPGSDIAAEFWAEHLFEPIVAVRESWQRHFGSDA